MKNTVILFLLLFYTVQNSTAQTIDSTNIKSEIENLDSIINHIQKINSSVCINKNIKKLIPIRELDNKKIVSISIDTINTLSSFQNTLKKYSRISCIAINSDSISTNYELDHLQLKNKDILIISIHDITTKNLEQASKLLSKLEACPNIILSIFGSLEIIEPLPIFKCASTILFSNNNTEDTHKVAAQIIFGGLTYSEHSPTVCKSQSEIDIALDETIRFQYTIPEMAGIDSETLYHIIDSVAQLGIENNAFPGCQILIAKDRKVIYHKCFGFHTYAKLEPVLSDDIYDLASVTKITGPLPALMRFVDEGKINIDEKLSVYWKDFKRSNKADVLFRDVLAHQAQLAPWIPFWNSTIDENKNFKRHIFSFTKTKKYSVEVAPQMYLNKNYRKKLYKSIKESDLLNTKEYRYSGLAYFIFPEMIKNMTHKEYPNYLKQEFYRPLGAYTIDFNAHNNYPASRIIPTEYDNYFRNTQLHGYVDDEGCAMMGGISGNAGLFATANDLAKLMQMYLQMGEYGGKRYISEKTMKEFTKIQFPDNNNRRGLGFDKPLLGNDTLSIEKCYPAYSASAESFGHSGFTGTFTWMDPKNNLLYIFLSNRVHPTRKSRQIYEKNIRISIHQGIYDAIQVFNEKYKQKTLSKWPN
ncbi:serine hydrolase [Labilibaculum sp. K2S]|uniref:serine hydrolase domain-containing protein n=1 Tax=Labilibaculum sp. K2S TaxID=3056386 RepID=UPI0025A376AD|nr:serine hydrolase [Labilibaculum sp. K2S]MDM8160814.1 serine hydrolase [Labilibaculum sp. K2S]